MGDAVAQVRELKRDGLGRVELVEGTPARVRRIACGGRVPGSAFLARRLLARERAALRALAGLEGTPELCSEPEAGSERGVLERTFVDGVALHEAERLAEDFFERLRELVEAMHSRGVCHNDLHKEQNIVVGADGWPHLIDFQLASTHNGPSRLFESRVRDDLRHVQKHRRRYFRDGRGPAGVDASFVHERRPPRSALAYTWRRFGKPLYNGLTRGLLRWRDAEARRPSSGPWPSWDPPRGPRAGA